MLERPHGHNFTKVQLRKFACWASQLPLSLQSRGFPILSTPTQKTLLLAGRWMLPDLLQTNLCEPGYAILQLLIIPAVGACHIKACLDLLLLVYSSFADCRFTLKAQ